jgi:hypothetical protein
MMILVFVPGVSAANNVKNIEIEVILNDDGSANITQIWTGYFHEGTEGYIVINNLQGMDIEDFQVKDRYGDYTSEANWNINASFAEKSRKYGIVKTAEGYELCWGLSEYGEREYIISYKVRGIVGSYNDYDGLHFQFVNSGMSTLPTSVQLTMFLENGTPLNEENARIWAFGYHGEINFMEDGSVYAYTEIPLSVFSDNFTILFRLDKEIVSPERVVSSDFNEKKEDAFIDSDYVPIPEREPSFLTRFLGFIIIAIPVTFVGYQIVKSIRRKQKIKQLYKDANYYREIPLNGNIEAAYVLAKDFQQAKEDGNLIGAAFLKLINENSLHPLSEKKVGFFGRETEIISLRLVNPPVKEGFTTHGLYDLLILASGEDQILQERELEKYSKKNHTAVFDLVESAKTEGDKRLAAMKLYDKSKEHKLLGLSAEGEKQLSNIMGFKKFLLDFSLINERGIAEALLWQDYLTFAMLFGIADKVIEQFKKVYPVPTDFSEQALASYQLSTGYTAASYFAAAQAASNAAQVARSSGLGGGSSYGGGGGFSGGGIGGGTR